MIIVGESIPKPLTWHSWINWECYFKYLSKDVLRFLEEGVPFEELVLVQDHKGPHQLRHFKSYIRRATATEMAQWAVERGDISHA